LKKVFDVKKKEIEHKKTNTTKSSERLRFV